MIVSRNSTRARYWDETARIWQRARPQRLWRAYCDELHAGLLRRWLPPQRVGLLLKTDVFDEAIGQGLYPVLAQAADGVVGLDISTGMLRGARSRHVGLTAVGGDVCNLPFDDGVFDIIVSNSTLDHMDSMALVKQGLAELQRVLRPGGQLVLTLDNLHHPAVALRSALPQRLLRRMKLVPYYVGVTCGPDRLRQLAGAAGFDVLEMQAVMHCPRALGVWCGAVLDRLAGAGARRTAVRCLLAMERLASAPTRFLTGHYIAVHAVKPTSPPCATPSAPSCGGENGAGQVQRTR